jgi:putative transposase
LNGRELLCAVTSTALLPIIHILSSESARKVMIMREHELSVTKQVKALRMSRGSVYYLPRPVSATDLEIVRLLDRLHLDFPFAGSLTLQGLLPAEGCKVGRRHVKPLINRMGIRRSSSADHEARAGAQDLSLSAARDGNRPAEPGVAMDIPMVRGFVYRAVMLDCFGRRVLSWGVSITLEAAFSVETLEDGLALHGKPDIIFNTDRGSQFTGAASTGVLTDNGMLSAWTARVLGGTTCSSSACGAASSMRRSICGPTTASAMRVLDRPHI